MDYLKIAGSLAMWLCVVPAILVVVVQAAMFARKAYKCGLEIGMTKAQLKSAIRASAVSSIGPSLAILSGMLALLGIAGGPISWMRLSYIGNVVFESMAFNFGVIASGATAEAMTSQAFINGVYVMITGSLGWIIFSILFTDKMDKVQHKLSGGNPAKMNAIAGGAMVGGMASLASSHVFSLNMNSVACLIGAAIMVIIYLINSKVKAGWLREWALTFALIGAIVIVSLIH